MGTSKRDRIKMTPEEVGAFLAASFKVQVATLGKEREPHLVTMFYTLLDGRIAFSTYRSSQKVLNLRRDPTMTCLVEDGSEYSELRGVALYGTGRIIDDPDTRLKVGAVVGARLAGLPVPELGAPLEPEFAEAIELAMAKRVIIVMEPDRVATWDHRKL
ncbi:pyridoxamine 5'-phosphate oxidase family protein [Actinomadura atramentaria]|uniref:pyridoxamine 5'-phosphate oxidase family protein n=1 Tax=Actinomadura atramentaria TaxID=1990 RepID=UPI000372F199|nr:pyridoxamine 5'-phosphate oxidase family protein [Actinomadura atramentaria]